MTTAAGKWYLGATKDSNESVYLYDFKWECEWYWAGGYVGNHNFHAHFDSCFLNPPDPRGHSLGPFYSPEARIPDYLEEIHVYRIENGASVWEPLSFFLDNAQYSESAWWRIKDLFTQFYTLRQAAGTFRHGGHVTGRDRSPAEINPLMAGMINEHIEVNIIPELRNILDQRAEDLGEFN